MPFEMKPLVCDPKRLRGLSEKLIVSHYENKLWRLPSSGLTASGRNSPSLTMAPRAVFVVNGLKREGTHRDEFHDSS